MAAGEGLYIARDSALISVDGVDTQIIAGQTIAEEGAAILKGREGLFQPLTVHYPAPERTARGRVASRSDS